MGGRLCSRDGPPWQFDGKTPVPGNKDNGGRFPAYSGNSRPLTNLFFFVWGCMKGPPPLHIQSAAAACTQQGWKPFGLPSRLRRPRTTKSKILTPRRRSGPSGRFFYHFPAVTEGDRKMMQLEKMKFFIFSKGVDFVNTQRFPAYSGNSMVSSTGQWSEPKIS